MVEDEDVIEGPYVVAEAETIAGRVLGDVIVPAGRHLDLDGHVTGDVIVARSASVVLRGSVAGTLVDYGGSIRVVGIVGARANLAL